MLPKSQRLPSQNISRVRTTGKRIVLFPFELRYISTLHDTSRLHVVVPKRLDKRSTVRNRQKRLLHAALSPLLSHRSPTFDGILTLKQLVNGEPSIIRETLINVFKTIQ